MRRIVNKGAAGLVGWDSSVGENGGEWEVVGEDLVVTS